MVYPGHMVGGGGSNAPPSSITSHSSPRSYDVGLLFCIRAVNLAWQEATKVPSADQAVSQWLLQRVAFFHTVADEGANPRRPCPTDVEMQPLREVSSSVSPQRTSASLPHHQPSLSGVGFPHTLVPEGVVDFSSIASAAAAGGTSGVDVGEALSLSRISDVAVSPGGETTLADQTPQFTRHRPTSNVHCTTQRSGGIRAPSASFAATASRFTRGQHTDDRHHNGLSSAYRCPSTLAPTAASPGRGGGGDHPRHMYRNKGFMLLQELLLVSLDLDEKLFCTMTEALLAVLPRSSTTHAEIALAMFENYPYITPTEKSPSSADAPPDVLLESADNATGNALKSFLVYMNIMFNCGSFERQCEILEMCKLWRVWLQHSFGAHVCHVATMGGVGHYLGSTSPQGQGEGASPLNDNRFKEDDYISWSRATLSEALIDDSSTLQVEQLMHEAMLGKDVAAVANTVHRRFEHRLGADGTGKALLEVLLDPTMQPPPPTSPIAFLFGVEPAAASTRQGAAAPPPAIDGASPPAVNSNHAGGSSAEIHAAISCGILTFGHFYYSIRSTRAALRCAEMAVLNGHQSGFTDTLALAHLLRSRCHCALGDTNAAAEDVTIALQLSLPQATARQQQGWNNGSNRDWWVSRTMAFQSAAELLIFFPGAVDTALRGALMQSPLPHCRATSAEHSDHGGNDAASAPRSIEVIQTLAQSVLHTVWCASVSMVGSGRPTGGTSFETVSAITNDCIRVSATSLGVACYVAPVCCEHIESAMSAVREDALVLPENRIMCSTDSVILEFAKLAVAQAVQRAFGEYVPPTSYSPANMSPLEPLEELLECVQLRSGCTELLDRCTHFAVAVDAVAAYVLQCAGYMCLAEARVNNALRRLFDNHDEDWLLPATDTSLDDENRYHWPAESLVLLLLCTKVSVDLRLFQGNIDDAQRAVDIGQHIFTRFGFARGIIQCHVLQASVWQIQRERAAQVQCLTFARDTAQSIGYLPAAAAAHLQLISAHVAVADVNAGALAWNYAPWGDELIHHIKSDPHKYLQIRVIRAVLRVLAGGGEHLPSPSLIETLAKEFHVVATKVGGGHVVSIQGLLSSAATLIGLAERLSAADPTTKKESLQSPIIHSVKSTASRLFALLKARRSVDSWRGIGDSLIETCHAVRIMDSG